MPHTAANPPSLPGFSTLIVDGLLDDLLTQHRVRALPRLRRFWDYYRNPPLDSTPGDGPTATAQQRGLPARLTRPAPGVPREIVIENDIAWRVHALTDFMLGRPLVIQSLAPDARRAAALTAFLRQTFVGNGGHTFFHDLVLLGSVYGYVDALVRLPDASSGDTMRLDLIEAPRAVPLLDPADYRRLDAYVIHQAQLSHRVEPRPFMERLRGRAGSASQRGTVERTEVWTAEGFETFVTTRGRFGSVRGRVDGGANRLGRVPVVHIQNLPQPFHFEGLSDVEPLIPLQDELNTRLSDRANRVTFQSFRMYLGKGIEGFLERPVGPGQMWSTDNPEATITEFGGDAQAPSEDQHIQQVREAMDKASGVSPIAAGVVGGKVGNLSSENAIRIVLLGLLARIEKKRVTYGEGVAQLCELILHAADVTGLLPNHPDERRVRLDWPTPFPDSEGQQLQNALVKKQLGVPRGQLLAELGYAECPPPKDPQPPEAGPEALRRSG